MGFFEDLVANAVNDYIYNNDKSDLIRILVFIVGKNEIFDKDIKKEITEFMKTVYTDYEEISFFELEPELDKIYNEVKTMNNYSFFNTVLSNHIDRDKIISMYTYGLFFSMQLLMSELFSAQRAYNLIQIKNHLQLSRHDIAKAYSQISNFLNSSIDDVAEVFEVIENMANEIKSEVPKNDCIEDTESNVRRLTNKNTVVEGNSSMSESSWHLKIPLEEIEELYNDARNYASSSSDPFTKYLRLCKECPNKLQGALSYAKLSKNETPVLVYDDTLLGSGRDGFLITDSSIYIHEPFESNFKKVSLEKIFSFELKAGVFGGAGKMLLNGIPLPTTMVHGNDRRDLYDFLQKVINV